MPMPDGEDMQHPDGLQGDYLRRKRQRYEAQLKEKQRKDNLRLLSLVTSIGISTAVCVAAGIFLGWLSDRLLSTSPIFLIIFTILGVAAAFKNIYDISKNIK